jgi:hypothetical protein
MAIQMHACVRRNRLCRL